MNQIEVKEAIREECYDWNGCIYDKEYELKPFKFGNYIYKIDENIYVGYTLFKEWIQTSNIFNFQEALGFWRFLELDKLQESLNLLFFNYLQM